MGQSFMWIIKSRELTHNVWNMCHVFDSFVRIDIYRLIVCVDLWQRFKN